MGRSLQSAASAASAQRRSFLLGRDCDASFASRAGAGRRSASSRPGSVGSAFTCNGKGMKLQVIKEAGKSAKAKKLRLQRSRFCTRLRTTCSAESQLFEGPDDGLSGKYVPKRSQRGEGRCRGAARAAEGGRGSAPFFGGRGLKFPLEIYQQIGSCKPGFLALSLSPRCEGSRGQGPEATVAQVR